MLDQDVIRFPLILLEDILLLLRGYLKFYPSLLSINSVRISLFFFYIYIYNIIMSPSFRNDGI